MRLRLLKRLILISFLLLIGSLAYNQLIKGPYYLQLSRNNRIKLIRLAAARGLIYDRKGRVLAGARTCFNVAVLSQEVRDVRRVFTRISPVLGISDAELLRQFKRNFSAPFIPVVVARDIPRKTAIALECKESEIPGLLIQTEPLRDYRYGEGLCHILGYLGRIREDELSRTKRYGAGFKDLVGRSGVEERFDRFLRGQAGGMQVEVNSRGYKVKVLGKRVAQKGRDLYLTVDAELQSFVNGLLEERKGACVVMNPQNGAILALATKPGFEPNLFIAALNEKATALRRIRTLFNSKQAPLLNRAISGVYSPGSIFKLVVACAGLETGELSPEDRIVCTGSLHVGKREFVCWNLDGHGSENIYSSLAHSCNVFFYKLGLALGPQRLTSFARKFGLGSLTGIDLPYEQTGLVPSKGWKLKTHKERWYDGETANFSIGQGYLLATPLQIARMISAVANGGYLVRPHVVERIGGQKSVVLRKKIPVKKRTLEIIKEGMRRVIQEEQGTGHKAYISGVQWAAKTGTAQTSEGLSHGWFAGFYPLDEPHIQVLVFLEYGGSGGDIPALIAKKIVKYIIENNI